MTEVHHYLASPPTEATSGGYRQDTLDGEQLRMADRILFTGKCFVHVKRLEKPMIPGNQWDPSLYAKREPFSY